MMTPTKIRNLRKRLNLTQIEFGALIGVKWLTIHRLEHGTRKPKGAIAKMLGLVAKS